MKFQIDILWRFLRRCQSGCARLWRFGLRCGHHLRTALFWFARGSGLKWLFSEIPIIAFLLTALSCSILIALILRRKQPETVLLVSAFEVPAASNPALGISGRTIGNILVDEMGSLTVEANRYLAVSSSVSTQQNTLHLSTGTQLEKPTIDVEVEGISLKGMALEWDKLRQNQTIVNGDLYWGTTGAVLRVRIDPDWKWEKGPINLTPSDITAACHETALRILSEWDPKIAGVIYQERGQPSDLAQSVELYRRWVGKARNDSEKAQAYFQLGVVYDLNGDLKNALQSYNSALSLRPALPEALANRGFVLQRLQRVSEAIADYQAALRLFGKDDFITLVNLGNSLDDVKQYDGAINCYRKALALSPANPYLHYNLAITMRRANRSQESQQEMKEYLSLQHSNKDKPTRPR